MTAKDPALGSGRSAAGATGPSHDSPGRSDLALVILLGVLWGTAFPVIRAGLVGGASHHRLDRRGFGSALALRFVRLDVSLPGSSFPVMVRGRGRAVVWVRRCRPPHPLISSRESYIRRSQTNVTLETDSVRRAGPHTVLLSDATPPIVRHRRWTAISASGVFQEPRSVFLRPQGELVRPRGEQRESLRPRVLGRRARDGPDLLRLDEGTERCPRRPEEAGRDGFARDWRAEEPRLPRGHRDRHAFERFISSTEWSLNRLEAVRARGFDQTETRIHGIRLQTSSMSAAKGRSPTSASVGLTARVGCRGDTILEPRSQLRLRAEIATRSEQAPRAD